MGLAKTDRTAHPLLSRILLARTINQVLGGAVVGPWDLGQLPDEYLDALSALAYDLPDYRKGVSAVQGVFAAWRAKHPTYRH